MTPTSTPTATPDRDPDLERDPDPDPDLDLLKLCIYDLVLVAILIGGFIIAEILYIVARD
jgi:hypothetical protein